MRKEVESKYPSGLLAEGMRDFEYAAELGEEA
jgi:hypothetical protein